MAFLMNDKIRTDLLFRLLRAEVCGDKLCVDDFRPLTGSDWEQITAIAAQHELSHLVSDAILRFEPAEDDTVLNSAKRRKYFACYHHALIESTLKRLKEIFNSAEIPFIPLKGAVICRYYPSPWMRSSGDLDILVKKDDFQKAENLLKSAGYRYLNTTPHDVSFKSPQGIKLELHHSLIESGRIGKAEKLLDNIWDHAELTEGSEYRLKEEMFYHYHLAHMAKHIENGGCGIRPFLDLWLLNHRFSQGAKRSELLRQGGLTRFSEAANALAVHWFSGEKADENTLNFESFILSGGAFGSKENNVVIKSAAKRGTKGYLWSKIWMDYENLCCQYPELKGKRVLQPAYEVRRWLRIVFSGNSSYLTDEIKLTHNLESELANAKGLWRYLGFD